jgi:hypothetical protein
VSRKNSRQQEKNAPFFLPSWILPAFVLRSYAERMIAGLLSALVLLVRPEAMGAGAQGAEVLLAAGLLAAALTVVAVLRSASAPRVALPVPATHGFSTLRVRLRASDPAAAGHRRARAPGSSH